MIRKLAATLLLAAAGLMLTGCGGSGGAAERPVDDSLTVHKGKGFSVGYPKTWKRDPQRPVFRGADFEVQQPEPGGGSPKASWSVFTEHSARALDRLVNGFVARSRQGVDFQLLERKKLDEDALSGHEGYVVRKAYTDTAGKQRAQLRQVDLFVRVSPGSVADVRMVFFADRYDSAKKQIDAVIGSFRVTG
jgi:hypothetical protein